MTALQFVQCTSEQRTAPPLLGVGSRSAFTNGALHMSAVRLYGVLLLGE